MFNELDKNRKLVKEQYAKKKKGKAKEGECHIEGLRGEGQRF